MRGLTRAFVLAAFVAVACALALPAFAFAHGGDGTGPTTCDGCHRLNWGKGPHGGYSTTTSRCEACHYVHDAAGTLSLTAKATSTGVCWSCHDGTGAEAIYGSLTARGVEPLGGHDVDTTTIVPGGDPSSGGDRTGSFTGVGGNLGCDDCHSPHDAQTVTAFGGERIRYLNGNQFSGTTSRLLKQHPTGSDTTVTAYGSDWCAGCHQGRRSGGAVHNHPVDSLASTSTPFDYSHVAQSGYPAGVGIALDGGGDVYVCDPGNIRVQKFSSGGAYQMSYTVPPEEYGTSLLRPTGVSVNDLGQVYIADIGVNRLMTFSADGSVWWVRDGTTPLLDFPGTFDTEYSGSAVWMMTKMGNLYPYGPGAGYDLSTVEIPTARYFFNGFGRDSASGRLYVSESINDQVWMLDGSGSGVNAKWGSHGSGNLQFDNPSGIAVDSAGLIYVVDTGNDRIQVLSSAGAFVRQIGTAGSGNGQLSSPAGVCVDDANGWVYVVDSGNSRVQKFTKAGVYVSQFGTYGTGDGQFALPYSDAVVKPVAAVPDAMYGSVKYYMLQSAFTMAYPRSPLQQGHSPICQQCHEDSRQVGSAEDPSFLNASVFGDTSMPRAFPNAPANPRFQNFPHETENTRMLIESGDDLCLNCHPANVLP